jgi:uncharacterized membrane protein HdeD (DUF308 family)
VEAPTAQTLYRRRLRWLRLLARCALLIAGGVQCLLGVIFGVSLGASALVYLGDGPGLVASSVLLLLLDLALLAAGLLALISALEVWDPPGDRWQGIRWPVLGGIGGGITLVSWLVAGFLYWFG